MTEKNPYKQRLEAWEKARFAPAPEAELNPTPPSFTTEAPMRDGVKLYTEVFLPPESDSAFPTVLIRSPYPYSKPSRHDKMSISRYLDAGYALVFQLTRGQGQSEGTFHFFSDDVDDGYDAVAWVPSKTGAMAK